MTQKFFWLLGLLACLLAATPTRAQVRPDSLPATAAALPDTAARLPAAAPATAAAPDSAASAQAAAPGSADENDFNPGLGLFALFAVVVMLVGIGAGVVLALLAVALAAALLAVGVVSSAALVGLWQRSWWAALRALLWALALLGGAAAGWLVALVVYYADSAVDKHSGLVLSIGAGAGLLLGGLAAYTCQRVVLLVLVAARRRWPQWLPASQ